MQFSTTPADFYNANYGSSDSALARLTEDLIKFVDQTMQEALQTATTNFSAVNQIFVDTNKMMFTRRPDSVMMARAIADVVNGLNSAGFKAQTTSSGRDANGETILINLQVVNPNDLPSTLTDREKELLNKLEELVCNAPKAVPRMASTTIFESANELILKYRPDFKTLGRNK
jgi:fructose-1,6-bisphosphatase